MSLNRVWVLAEAAEGKPTSLTLELLTKARELGSTIEAVAWGPDTAAIAGELGAHGATAVHDIGDLGDVPAGRARRCRDRGGRRGGQRPGRCCSSARPTTAATSPVACRPSSTSPC